MGPFWRLIQNHLDKMEFAPSNRKLAMRLGVAPTTLTNWRNGLKDLPDRENLEAVAAFLGKSYEVVLNAALKEIGYAVDAAARPRPERQRGDDDKGGDNE